VLVHGIGLHGRTWDPVVAELPHATHVIAVDLRGHGRSAQPPLPEPGGHVRWSDCGEDVAELVAALDLPAALGVGHSMGGHAMVFAAEHRPEAFGSLLLLDPTIGSPDRAARPQPARAEPHPVSRRRNEWSSPQAMIERLAVRAPFASWDPAALRAYCEFGLIPAADGSDGYVLACPPVLESMVWGGGSTRIYDAIAHVRAPVRIVRAQPSSADDAPDFQPSQTWPGAPERFAAARDQLLPGRGHFFPLESPALTAQLIVDGLAEAAG
jgi:pimeloyl-ACP methyl ester carboxylesterase